MKMICCAAAVLWLGACGGKEAAAKGMYGEHCTDAEDCVSGLICPNGICTKACDGDAQCQSLQKGLVCNSGACYAACRDGSDCAALGVPCLMSAFTPLGSGICRPN